MIVGAECSATNVNGRGPVSKEDSTAISNAMARCPKSLSETRTSPNSASFSFLALLQLQSQSAERTAASSEQGHPVPIQKAAPNGSGRMNPLPPSPGCQARNDYGIDIWSMVDLYRACHWVHLMNAMFWLRGATHHAVSLRSLAPRLRAHVPAQCRTLLRCVLGTSPLYETEPGSAVKKKVLRFLHRNSADCLKEQLEPYGTLLLFPKNWNP